MHFGYCMYRIRLIERCKLWNSHTHASVGSDSGVDALNCGVSLFVLVFQSSKRCFQHALRLVRSFKDSLDSNETVWRAISSCGCCHGQDVVHNGSPVSHYVGFLFHDLGVVPYPCPVPRTNFRSVRGCPYFSFSDAHVCDLGAWHVVDPNS